jgi:hypothetical protein
MKKCFTEELIIGRLKETKARMKVAELCRKHGILDATYYKIINFYHFLADGGSHKKSVNPYFRLLPQFRIRDFYPHFYP